MLNHWREDLYRRALAVPLELVEFSPFAKAGIEVWVRRDDLIDPYQSGNKFYKLHFNLAQAKSLGARQILSFGGPWSNHLHALAYAGAEAGFGTIGIVRGEQPPVLSQCLLDAQAAGMKLQFVSRADYDRKASPDYLAQLANVHESVFMVPEGGANLLGARGMEVLGQTIAAQVDDERAAICLACGTGTSLAGVAAGLLNNRVYGFSVLKGASTLGGGLVQDVDNMFRCLTQSQSLPANWRLISGFHGGGYGRKPHQSLRQFWRLFELESGLSLDPVYTLKLFWGISVLAEQGYWRKGTKIVAIHTGGLQGRRGFAEP